MTKLSLVIPCYNEGGGLPALLRRIKAISGEEPDIEFVLVDNGSRDATVDLVKNAPLENPSLRVIRVEVNRGYGYGILQGLKVAGGEFLGWTHADMQTDPADALRALKIIETFGGGSRGLFLKGRRYARPFGERFFTWGMGIIESLLFGRILCDINAQPTIFPRAFYEQWKNPPHDFSLDLYAYAMALRSRLKIVRFPVLFENREYGSSHWNTDWRSKVKFIKRTIDFSMRLRKNW
jgi:glycosyltransferase involved in cell wall biosynthesis